MPFGLQIPYWGIKAPSAITGPTYSGGILFAFRDNSTAGYTSSNANNYNSATMVAANSTCWSPDLKKLVAVTNGSIKYSNDGGVNWITSTGTTTGQHESVLWCSGFNMFVADGQGNPSNHKMIYSSTGSVWATASAKFANGGGAISIAYSSSQNRAVSVGYDGGLADHVQYTDDGINWIAATVSPSGGIWTAAGYSPELDRFVIAGDGTTTRSIAYSDDGINFTAIDDGDSAGIFYRSISWSPELGMFIALNYTSNIKYSYTGASWSTTAASGNWWGSQWCSELGLFVASQLSTTKLYYSNNGTVWSPSTTSLTSGNYNSVTWAPGLKSDFQI